ncbi:MAG TPA: NrfD/PsrC family molybdoenzyme membrane anchor subunit, partial [Kofleriaceae bacterium]|nr:NrfD/PsrC family molybdoenzyme membrane anchor subunit [Kofleriaceae bacterium]
MIRPPTTYDGRNLDPRLADPRGEGAGIEVSRPETAWPAPTEAQEPTTAPAETYTETYYDLPVVKPPPWKWYVAAYFYGSGLGGAAATAAAAAELAGQHQLARRLHRVAAISEAAGAACLIADLGRPTRFHHMMRVFRPSSPMNVGVWILSAASASSGLAVLGDLRGRRGLGVAGAVGAIAGALLSTYTGVLIGNTAIPIWAATRRRMPAWFAAEAAASLASLDELLAPARGERLPRSYHVAAKAAALIGARSVETGAAAAGVARPLRDGRAGQMWRGATWLAAGSLIATLARRPRLAGVLGTVAALAVRFALIEAGRASAADPRATFGPQRRIDRPASRPPG